MVKEQSATPKRRRELRNELIDVADSVIASEGLSAVTVRTVAAKAGCSVGSIYNVFEDFDELIMAVNSKTLARLDREIAQMQAQDAGEKDHTESLVGIGLAYCRFARKYPRLWSALFERGLMIERDIPEWHMDEHVRLFKHIVTVLNGLAPERSQDEIWMLARTMFSAVHGVVSLGMRELFVAVPAAEIEKQVSLLLRAMVKGLFGVPRPQVARS